MERDRANLAVALIAVALGALLLRVWFLGEFAESPLFPPVVGGNDRAIYHEAAQGPLWPEGAFNYMPLYPTILRAVYAMTGPRLHAAALFGIACDVATVALIVLTAVRLGSRPLLASAAGALYALYPLAIAYAQLTMPNTLNALLVAVFAYASLAAPRDRVWSSIALGLIGGVAALGWAAWISMGAAWVAFDIARGPDRWKRMRHGAWFALAFALPLLPVAWHNTRAEGHFVLLTTHSGLNFYMGNHERATGHTVRIRDFRMSAVALLEDAHRAAELETGRTLTRAESSRWWSRQARAFWREQPLAALRLTLRKALLFWNRVEVDDLRMVEQARLLIGCFTTPWWPGFAAIGVIGLIGLFRAPRASALKVLAIAGIASLVMYFITARYRLTLAPLLLALGAAGVTGIIDDFLARRYFIACFVLLTSAVLVFFPLHVRDLRATDHYNAALQLLQANRAEEALRVAEAGLRIDPQYAPLHQARGEALFTLESFDLAATAFAECLRADPSQTQAIYNLALSLARAGDICGARRMLESARLQRELPPRAAQLLHDLIPHCPD